MVCARSPCRRWRASSDSTSSGSRRRALERQSWPTVDRAIRISSVCRGKRPQRGRSCPAAYPSPVPRAASRTSRTTSIDLTPPVEKAFLLAVDTGDDTGWTAEDSLSELANLATTAGAEVVGAEWQNRRHVDPNWYVGKGKAEELAQASV